MLPGVPGAAARVKWNRVVYLVPADYVVWSKDLADYTEQVTKWLREHYPKAQREAWFTGRASDRTKQQLGLLGWSIQEGKLRRE